MKSKVVFTALFVIAAFSMAIAQPRGRGGDPEERAERSAQMMADSLSLSDAQKNKVKEIHLKYGKQMQEAREKSEGDWSSMRETMGAIRTEQDKELQTVMTSDQWASWQKIRENQRAMRAEGRRGPDGGPPPGQEGKNKRKGKKPPKDKSGTDQPESGDQ